MGWGLFKKDFTERVNLRHVSYHIIDSVKNAGRWFFFFFSSKFLSKTIMFQSPPVIKCLS